MNDLLRAAARPLTIDTSSRDATIAAAAADAEQRRAEEHAARAQRVREKLDAYYAANEPPAPDFDGGARTPPPEPEGMNPILRDALDAAQRGEI